MSFSVSVFSGPITDTGDVPEIRSSRLDSKIQSNKDSKAAYKRALDTWRSKKISRYYVKIRYGAFSPIAGVWELYVRDGAIVTWIFNNEVNPSIHKETAIKFTMESLFKEASRSCQNSRDGYFVIVASYDRDLGYVKSVARIANRLSKKTKPDDKTYKYEVIDFKVNKK
jgi:hypothetical protein